MGFSLFLSNLYCQFSTAAVNYAQEKSSQAVLAQPP
jgi:hypothetical protein